MLNNLYFLYNLMLYGPCFARGQINKSFGFACWQEQEDCWGGGSSNNLLLALSSVIIAHERSWQQLTNSFDSSESVCTDKDCNWLLDRCNFWRKRKEGGKWGGGITCNYLHFLFNANFVTLILCIAPPPKKKEKKLWAMSMAVRF